MVRESWIIGSMSPPREPNLDARTTTRESDLVPVWIALNLALTFCINVFSPFFFFFFCAWTVKSHEFIVQGKNTIHRSHDTIHTFKNYFVTVFSIFNFNKNKLYPNRPLIISEMRFISRGRRTPSSIAIASVIFVAYMAGNSLFLRPPNFFSKDI